MADNYLEKKMDDYRRGVNARAPRRSYSGTAASKSFGAEHRRIALAIGCGDLLHALVTALQGAPDVKTAFAATDSRTGSLLAQSAGALCVPVAQLDESGLGKLMAEAGKRWGGVDAVVTDIPELASAGTRVIYLNSGGGGVAHAVSVGRSLTVLDIPASGYDAKTVAAVVLLMLASPAGAISSVTLR